MMMNSSEVMYHPHHHQHHPYATYFPYHQRGAHVTSSHAATIDQLKKFGLGKLADASDISSRTPGVIPHASSVSHPHVTPLASSGISSGELSPESKTSPCSPVDAYSLVPKREPRKGSSDEESCTPEPANAQYLSASCVLLTYFKGDTSSTVDEHFSRALNNSASNSSDDSSTGSKSMRSPSRWKGQQSPMAQRNFPASFWNSHYQPASGSSSLLQHGVAHPQTAPDLSAAFSPADNPYTHHMSPAVSLHTAGIAGGLQDPWRYPLPGCSTSQAYSHHHHSLQEFPYSSSRFNTYGSLLPTSSRGLSSMGAQCDPLAKHHPETWSSPGGRFGLTDVTSGLGHHDGLHPGGLHGGIDACALSSGNKDTVYWF